jgi:hypothetical protein
MGVPSTLDAEKKLGKAGLSVRAGGSSKLAGTESKVARQTTIPILPGFCSTTLLLRAGSEREVHSSQSIFADCLEMQRMCGFRSRAHRTMRPIAPCKKVQSKKHKAGNVLSCLVR